MTLAIRHEVQWVTASPLWAPETGPEEMQAPRILRFASDAFMEDLQARLASPGGSALADLVLGCESAAEPLPGEAPTPAVPGTPKLFQPAHGRFYLVAASLVCRAAGLPDRAVDVAAGERVGFVLRRRDDRGAESAWVPAPSADARAAHCWEPVPAGALEGLRDGEEIFPMFPVRYASAGRRRRLFVGLVPTSSRETFESAEGFEPTDGGVDPRLAELEARVLVPLADLRAFSLPAGAGVDQAAQVRDASRFLLLDLADLLRRHARPAWDALERDAEPRHDQPAWALYDLLSRRRADSTKPASLRDVLIDAWTHRDRIYAGDRSVADVHLGRATATDAQLRAALVAALGSAPAQPAPTSGTLPKLDPAAGVTYALRCVYERPRCGAMHAPVLSAPSERFLIAPFFDPDAPVRPVRIVMPLDTSPKGLRRFRKSVGIVLSSTLRNQLDGIPKLKALIDGAKPTGGGADLGQVCTFSIPILTIVALVVLMIFVVLLNIVFWWLPFLKVCLPIRKR